MGEVMRRIREPGAWLVLAAVGLSVALSIVTAALEAVKVGRLGALGQYGHSLIGPFNAFLLVAVVLVCVAWSPPSRRALPVAMTGAVIATIGTLVQFAFGMIGLIWPEVGSIPVASRVIDGVGFLVFTMIPGVATYVLWKMTAALRRERAERQAAPQAIDADTVPKDDEAESEEADADAETAGAVWHTAGEAAIGASASAWGGQGERGGWVPAQEKHESFPYATRALPSGSGAATADSESGVMRALPAKGSATPGVAHQPGAVGDFGPRASAGSGFATAADRANAGGQGGTVGLEPLDQDLDGEPERTPEGGRPAPVWSPLRRDQDHDSRRPDPTTTDPH